MTHDELMAQLKDIHLAPPPSFWPPAFGYYVVVFGALVLGALIVVLYRRATRVRMRKRLLAELNIIENDFAKTKDAARVQADVSALFRRLAFTADSTLAKASDLDAALPVLMRVTGDKNRMLAIVDLLKEERFHRQPQIDGAKLLSLAKEQLKRCRI